MKTKQTRKTLKGIIFLILLCLLAGMTACHMHPQDPSIDESSSDQNLSQIDQSAWNSILGEYQVEEVNEDGDEYVGSWWHLSIRVSEEGKPELSIYDNAAGNPGIQGQLTSLTSETMSLKYDPDYYDQLPSPIWKIQGDYLNMDYQLTDTGIRLTNQDKTLLFTKELQTITYACRWKPSDTSATQNLEITDSAVKLHGQFYTLDDGWIQIESTLQPADPNNYNDGIVEGSYVEKEAFLQALQNSKAHDAVVEIDIKGDQSEEIRFIHEEDSILTW